VAIRKIALVCFILLCTAMALPGPSGFCYQDMKFLTTEEMTQRLYEQLNSARPSHGTVIMGQQSVEATVLAYENLSDMLGTDIQCCRIKKITWPLNTSSNAGSGFEQWLLFDHSYFLIGKINTNFQLADGTKVRRSHGVGDGSRVVGSCGQLRN
jgi:hypothetical protein